MRHQPRLLVLLTAGIGAFLVHASIAQSPMAKFIPLNAPKSVGGFIPLHINTQGQIVGLSTEAVNKAILLDHGTYTPVRLPHPNGKKIDAISINNHGQIAGTYLEGATQHGFLLSHGTYTPIDYPPARNTSVWDINSQGDLAGFYEDPNDSELHGFLWKQGTFTPINLADTDIVEVFGLNDQGDMVGNAAHGRYASGFLLRNGVRTRIAFPGAVTTIPFGINNAGQIVGVCILPGNHSKAFLLSHGIYTTIPGPPAPATMSAVGINARGQIVGPYQDHQGQEHGYLHNP